jgi:hypothetical protein
MTMNASTLEARNYVATDADIRELAKAHRSASIQIESVPLSYLRALAAVTITALGAAVRVRVGKPGKLTDEQKMTQLAALAKTNEHFYALVVEEESKDLPSGKGRAQELNRRTNRYRTSYSVLRRWVDSGHDLTTVAPARISKSILEAAIPKNRRTRPPNPARVKKRAEASSKAAVATIMELAVVDKAAAIGEIELLIGQLAGQLAELGVATTRDPREAVSGHKLLKVKRGTFYPVTETQVIRQAERPS